MMETSQKIRELEIFLRAHGGHLHPDIEIAENDPAGLHWRAKKNIDSGSTIISTPHSLAFSYLNALVDEEWPVFKKYREQFRPDFAIEVSESVRRRTFGKISAIQSSVRNISASEKHHSRGESRRCCHGHAFNSPP